MSRSAGLRLAVLLVVAALAASHAEAQKPGERVRGVISDMELRGSPRTITVRLDSGGEVRVHVANRTMVIFEPGEAGYFPADPGLGELKVGMHVFFRYQERELDRIHVDSVPPNLRPQKAKPPTRGDDPKPPSGSGRRELKVRIQTIDERRGEFRADVAGSRESFRVREPRMLRRYSEGDLVVITVEREDGDEVVTDIRGSSVSGRVRRVDERRREIVIEVDGREEVYSVDDRDMLDDVRVGDRIRFEVEERTRGRKVITSIQ
jgi:Cu/Ag efflux protein CusF